MLFFGISLLQNAGLDISVSNTTRSIRTNFLATGKFEAYFDDYHLNSDKFAKRGGIFLKEGSHVVMALERRTRVFFVLEQVFQCFVGLILGSLGLLLYNDTSFS